MKETITNIPLVSILVPARNIEKYIKRCLRSLLEQTYSCIEIIVIDDFSEDGTSKLIEDASKLDNRIKVLKNKKCLGLSESRNKGIDFASGKYIVFVDGDDYVKKNMISTLVYKAQSTNSDLVVFNFKMMFDNCNIKEKSNLVFNKKFPTGIYSSMQGLHLLFSDQIRHFSWIYFIRKDSFLKNDLKFPIGRFFEDYATTYKWIYFSKQILVLNDRLYNYAQHIGSIMHTVNPRYAEDILVSTKEIDNFVSSKSISIKKSFRYELPRLLDAIKLLSKSKKYNKKLFLLIEKEIFVKNKVVGKNILSRRNRIKIFFA
ncbi:putative glycosyltransferase YfnE [Oenococcus oeni]|uniref:glycosyltransferase family 2 protein n=1 Tax=Oenococcus oeni TaxID=1247 RepID=UPI0010B07BD4|nr:glycosyltransferase family 2 protein [Oenococcus oeni]SYW05553.1 putative glycosyltransferase YfnE [Oenococcus oeni]